MNYWRVLTNAICVTFIVSLWLSLCVASDRSSTLLEKRRIRCKIQDIQFHLIAVVAPGMSKTVTVYAVSHQGLHGCYLPLYPVVWAAMNNHKKQLQRVPEMVNVKKNVVLLPSEHHHDKVKASQLVWFAVKGNAATFPGDKGYFYPFQSLVVGLTSLKEKTKVVAYKGFTSHVDVTVFNQGLSAWWFSKNCLSANQPLSADTLIDYKTVMHCD